MKKVLIVSILALTSGCLVKKDNQETRAIACSNVVQAVCAKSEECGSTSFEDCLSLSMADGMCSDGIVFSTDRLNDCAGQIKLMSCTDPMPIICME